MGSTRSKTRRARRLLIAAAAAAAASFTASPVADAQDQEVGGQAPVLAPVKSKPPKGGGGDVTIQQTVSTGRSYKCLEKGTLRRKHGSYIMGWCTPGMHIDISSGSIQGWQAGWGEGNFQGCGWFQSGSHALELNGVFDHNCGATEYNENYFATRINSGSTTDGNEVPIYHVCDRYANVRPWVSGSTAGMDHVGTLQPSTDIFKWRYLTKNQQWVMGRLIRDNYATYVGYDWVFVPRWCVGEPATRAASTTS